MKSFDQVRKIMIQWKSRNWQNHLLSQTCSRLGEWRKARSFPMFKLVFLLKCRDMKGDIVEDIFEQLLPEDLKEKNKEALVNFLEDLHNQKQILIIWMAWTSSQKNRKIV